MRALPKAWDRIPEDEHQDLVRGTGVHLPSPPLSSPSLAPHFLGALWGGPHSTSVSFVSLLFGVLREMLGHSFSLPIPDVLLNVSFFLGE